MTANTVLTLASLRRIAESPFSTERSKPLNFDLANGRVSLRSSNFDGEISAPIQAEGDFTIGFNARYVLETARALGGTIRLDLSNAGKPARVYGADPDAMFVLMPMRV